MESKFDFYSEEPVSITVKQSENSMAEKYFCIFRVRVWNSKNKCFSWSIYSVERECLNSLVVRRVIWDLDRDAICNKYVSSQQACSIIQAMSNLDEKIGKGFILSENNNPDWKWRDLELMRMYDWLEEFGYSEGVIGDKHMRGNGSAFRLGKMWNYTQWHGVLSKLLQEINKNLRGVNIMKLVDYTGKLNNHNEYLQTIKHLENKCKYIEYVLVNEDDTEFIEKFESLIISLELKNKWWGTKSSKKNKIYKMKSSNEIFKYLKQFETFCKYTISNYGDIVEDTDFGINDIAFFDDKDIPLLFTTTHEGYITIRDDLLSV